MEIVETHNLENSETENLHIVGEIIRKSSQTPDETRISFLGAGSCNTVYLVRSEDTHLVVKLSKPEREYKAEEEYKKEQWCLDTAATLAIPSPRVLEVGHEQGRVYMIQSYVEGTTAADIDGNSPLPTEVQRKIWRTLGEYAKKIHSIAITGYGEELRENGVFNGSWEKHLQYNIDSLNQTDELITRGILTTEKSIALRAKFLMLQQKKFTFGLNHGDLALRNTIITATGEIYLLDWGTARAEIVPHFDINEILRSSKPDSESLQAFLDGYGITKKEFETMKGDWDLLNILHEIDTLRWAIDKMPSTIEEHALKVTQALQASMFS